MDHASADGRFVMDLEDGTTWILYSSDPTIELRHVPASDGLPSL